MLGFGPISSSAISALPDYLLNSLSVSFIGTIDYTAVPFTPYMQLINGIAAKAYSMELNIRVAR